MREMLGTIIAWLLGLLAIGTLLVMFNTATSTSKTNQALSDLSSMVSSIQAIYYSHPSYSTLSPTVAINGKLAPQSMINGASLINPWGGTVGLAVNSSNSSRFDVTEPNVPSDACSKLATAIGNLESLAINGSSLALPSDPATVTTSCNNNINTMVFTFGH